MHIVKYQLSPSEIGCVDPHEQLALSLATGDLLDTLKYPRSAELTGSIEARQALFPGRVDRAVVEHARPFFSVRQEEDSYMLRGCLPVIGEMEDGTDIVVASALTYRYPVALSHLQPGELTLLGGSLLVWPQRITEGVNLSCVPSERALTGGNLAVGLAAGICMIQGDLPEGIWWDVSRQPAEKAAREPKEVRFVLREVGPAELVPHPESLTAFRSITRELLTRLEYPEAVTLKGGKEQRLQLLPGTPPDNVPAELEPFLRLRRVGAAYVGGICLSTVIPNTDRGDRLVTGRLNFRYDPGYDEEHQGVYIEGAALAYWPIGLERQAPDPNKLIPDEVLTATSVTDIVTFSLARVLREGLPPGVEWDAR